MTSDKKFIGSNIKKMRNEKKMTQADLANACYISNTVVSAYENGKKTPNLDTLANIARALNVSIDSLYYGSEEDAIIKRPTKKGRKIVNCFQYLYDEKVLRRFFEKGSAKLEVGGYKGVLTKLYNQLDEFNHDKGKYSDPDTFLEMMLEAAGNEIDEKDRKETEMNEIALNSTNPSAGVY